MNYVQIWFIIIAGLLGVGIPFLFIGLQLPNAMHAALLAEEAEYAILDSEGETFWANIPGDSQTNDTKIFYLFECSNWESVSARGSKPDLAEVGPFRYTYSHKFTGIKYEDDEKTKKVRANYVREFDHKFEGNAAELTKEYRVFNAAGFKRWTAIKGKERFHLAIEGFFELFTYIRNNIIRDVIMQELVDYYHTVTPIEELTKDLENATADAKEALQNDKSYGLMMQQNIYEWSTMCDTTEQYIEHEIMTYFLFNLNDFQKVKARYCAKYFELHDKYYNNICAKIPDCSYYNISFNQWMYANSTEKSYKEYTYKKLFGEFEFKNYVSNVFTPKLNPAYKAQFAGVTWTDKSYYYLLDTLYEYPDYITDPASLLLYDNMKSLFLAGRFVPGPFVSSPADSTLDLRSFEKIATTLKVTKEQAFMLYCYFDYFINNTVLLKQYGGTLEKERIGNYGALAYKDLFEYYSDYIDVLIYSRTLNKRNAGKNCIDVIKFYFTNTETEKNIATIANVLCTNTYFSTDVSTAVGWKYFLEASSYPYHYHYKALYDLLHRNLSDFSNVTLNAMLFKGTFWLAMYNIKIMVKAHYNDKTNNAACENSFSDFCSKRQFFFDQFLLSAITLYPYPEADLPASRDISAWWKLIEPYIKRKGEASPFAGDPEPLPDQPITVPVDIPFLTGYYGGYSFNKDDMYPCFNKIGLFDTDVMYFVLLNIKSPGSLDRCAKFATEFFDGSTRYLIRNVQFGPMFINLTPEQVYFGYKDKWTETMHELVDYLSGDDCTVNPWIGHNPKSWNTGENTFSYAKVPSTVYTGQDSNVNIRKYVTRYGKNEIMYRRLERDITGDKCSFADAGPFIRPALVGSSTDEWQFSQHAGKSPKGDFRILIDDNVKRPVNISRPNNDDYPSHGLVVNEYVASFADMINVCVNSPAIRNTFDMTSFYQIPAVVSMAQLANVTEPGLITPNIVYKHNLKIDNPPKGIDSKGSYFEVEPYTGITFRLAKKMMTSLAMYYDELYDKTVAGGLYELIPYYSMYETAVASDDFINKIADDIIKSESTRQATTVIFLVLGSVFAFAGVGMIVRAFFFGPEDTLLSENSQSLDFTVAPVVPAAETQNKDKDNDIGPPLLPGEGEDLHRPPEEKKD